VRSWLAQPNVFIPEASDRTAVVYERLTEQHNITANLVPDAMLAALAIEHGHELWTADTDFARFTGLRWRDPLA
jgi:uncharacterized protein